MARCIRQERENLEEEQDTMSRAETYKEDLVLVGAFVKRVEESVEALLGLEQVIDALLENQDVLREAIVRFRGK